MTTGKGFTSPNHTQAPNDLFDVHLKDMGECELKVVLWAIRKTMGFHKDSDEISITQFQKATGLSRQGVIDGIEAATKRGLIEEVGTGKRGVKKFGLVINSDQSNELTSSSQNSRPVEASTSQKSRPTKEIKKKEKEKKQETTPIPVEQVEIDTPSKQGGGQPDLRVTSKGKTKTPPSSAPPPKPKERGADFVAAAECAYGIAPDTNVPDSISDAVEKLVKAATDAFEVVFKTTDAEKIANAIRLFYKQHYPPNGKLKPIQKAPEFGAQFLAFIQTYRKPKAESERYSMPELPPVYQWSEAEIAQRKADLEALKKGIVTEGKIA